MIRVMIFSIVSFVLALTATASDPKDVAQQYLHEFREKHGYASVSAAVSIGDTVVYAGAAGFADIDAEVPATPATMYRIGSVSKVMTAIGVMQLVEAGEIDLDQPILNYMPNGSGNWAGVTPRQLLTHTSGIMHYGSGHPWNRQQEFKSVFDVVRLFADEKLLFKPGHDQRYSTYGFTLLHAIAETVSKKGFEDYLRDKVWQPANMTRTMFDRIDARPKMRAKGYKPWAFGRLGRLKETEDNVSFKYAGGGILSTPSDMVKLCDAFLSDKLVSQDVRMEMMRKQVGNFGLGWNVVIKREGGLHRVYHSGESLGYYAILNCYPAQNYAFAMTINTWNGGSNVFRDPIEFFAETFAAIPRQPDFW